MSKLTVTVTEQVSNVAVTEQVIEVNEATGIGPQGIAGVVSATAPVTYNSGTQTVGINAGVANGVATLDSDGKVPTTQLPPLAVNDTFVVASQAAMLALTAQVGDIAVRTDVTKTFILTASPASTLGNWQEILTPPGVTSITASSPLTGGTITSTGSIGIDQTALSIATTQLTGKITDAQLNSGVTTTGEANKIVKVGSSGVAQFNTVGAGTFYFSPSGGIVGQAGAGNHAMPLSDGGTLVSTADSKTVTTSMIADSAITSTQIADNTITSGDIQQLPGMYLPTSGIDTVPRLFLGGAQNPYSGGNIRFTTFQANQSFTASKIIVHVANTPAYATGTHQFFLCSYDQTTGYTPKGSSQLFTSASPLPNTGGALNSINLTALSGGNLSIVAGNWYAIGMWASSGFTTAPTHVAAAGSLASSIFAGAGSNSITLYPAYAASATSASAPTTTATITATASFAYPIWFRILP